MTSAKIGIWIVAAIILLGAVAYWDEERKGAESLADFATEKIMLAHTAATYLRDARPGESPLEVIQSVAPRLNVVQQPGEVVVLLEPPTGGLFGLDGVPAVSPPIERRLAAGSADGAWVRLAHPESAALGLPPRTAIAGIAEVDRPEGHWGLVVVSSAHRERDREERGLWRVGLGFFIASGIVVTFGTFAFRTQRKELELGQRLAVAQIERRLDERLVRADKLASLGALAMGIAHQVATPLGVIVARAERLAPRLSGDERSKRAVDVIAEQAQRINRVVRAFLGLARGGSPMLEHTNPRSLADAGVELVRHRFEKAQIRLEVVSDAALPKIACDARLFEQVIVNLLLNACDACSAGGSVVLTVRSRDSAVTFDVEDDGVGIAPETAARLMEPFFTTKGPDDGTGLGLAIAREIVVHHRGTLVLEPRAPHGTRARVEVPVAESAGS